MNYERVLSKIDEAADKADAQRWAERMGDLLEELTTLPLHKVRGHLNALGEDTYSNKVAVNVAKAICESIANSIAGSESE